MAMFRKKPVVVEAWQLTRENATELATWCGGQWLSLYGRGDRGEDISHIAIGTLEGVMRAELGDWIIKGTRREFYPCTPGPFADTFEAVEQSTGTVPAKAGSMPTNPAAPQEVVEALDFIEAKYKDPAWDSNMRNAAFDVILTIRAALAAALPSPSDRAQIRREAFEEAASHADIVADAAKYTADKWRADDPTLAESYDDQSETAREIAIYLRALSQEPRS